jgi:hydroxyacylglutathione hydrolase
MPNKIKTISLSMPFGMGSVNCYLIPTGEGFVLIDTGLSSSRKDLARELESAGCTPGALKLIIITHGDFDHIGNAAYLRDTFGAMIAMHADDAGMAERGDMFFNRKKPNAIIRTLLPVFTRLGKADRFSPDLPLRNGDDLSDCGLVAQAFSIPGHSRGSVAVLTAAGDLFCGDLLANTERPAVGALIDDPAAAKASVQKIKSMSIGMVYPGHGKPFPMDQLKLESV